MSVWKRGARAVAEAMFATAEGPPPADRVEWLCDDFDDFVEMAGPRSQAILGGALALATFAAPLTIGRPPPLARLSVDDRGRALEALERTPAGLPLLALKAILCTIYFEHPEVRRRYVDEPAAEARA